MTDYEQAYCDLRAGAEALAERHYNEGVGEWSGREHVCGECGHDWPCSDRKAIDALLASSAPATASEPVEYADLRTLTDEELAAAEAPTATASEGATECRCQIIGWNHDPYEPHIPKVPEYDQADDCPVHPLATGVASPDGYKVSMDLATGDISVSQWTPASSDGDRGLSEEIEAIVRAYGDPVTSAGRDSLRTTVRALLDLLTTRLAVLDRARLDALSEMTEWRQAATAARTAQPEGVERVEWGVRYSGTDDVDRWCCESCATLAAGDVDDVMVRRTVTSWPDVVGPWEVDGDE